MVNNHMGSMTENREEDELEWEGSVLDYASPYRTKDKTAIDAYPINSAMKKLRISSTEALELVFKNQYVPYAIASARQYKADDNCNKL